VAAVAQWAAAVVVATAVEAIVDSRFKISSQNVEGER
jgi:hypothetical protein